MTFRSKTFSRPEALPSIQSANDAHARSNRSADWQSAVSPIGNRPQLESDETQEPGPSTGADLHVEGTMQTGPGQHGASSAFRFQHRPERPEAAVRPFRTRVFGFLPRAGFTLIELLIVIAIISILAALIFPSVKGIQRRRMISKARVELTRLQSAIEAYKDKLGHYPPDNPTKPYLNQLYFELCGTRFNSTNSMFYTLDGSAQIAQADVSAVFQSPNVSGFVNSTRGASGDEGTSARSFLSDLRPDQVAEWKNNQDIVKVIVCSVKPGPYEVSPTPPGSNPFRYNSSNPTNNPATFDLWVDILIGGRTNRIGNWSKDPILVATP